MARKSSKSFIDATSTDRSACCLWLVEGKTALEVVAAAVKAINSNKIGVCSTGGLNVNVLGKNKSKKSKNVHFDNISQLLNLKSGKEYESIEERNELRYGKLVLCSDGDPDGHYQNALLLSYFHADWPSLLRTGFIYVIKIPENCCVGSLPSSTLEAIMVNGGSDVEITADENAASTLLKAFGVGAEHKKARTSWVEQTLTAQGPPPQITLDGIAKQTITEYITLTMAAYFVSNVRRLSPDWLDGCHRVQRLTVAFLLTQELPASELRIDRLASKIGELFDRKENDAYIKNAITVMGRTSLATNLVPLVAANSDFGEKQDSARHGGNYRTVSKPAILKYLFPGELSPYLKYRSRLEPESLLPILPISLLNGSQGSCEGFNWRYPSFSPTDLINNLSIFLSGEKMPDILPTWRNYTGQVIRTTDNYFSFVSAGTKEVKVITGNHRAFTAIYAAMTGLGVQKFESAEKMLTQWASDRLAVLVERTGCSASEVGEQWRTQLHALRDALNENGQEQQEQQEQQNRQSSRSASPVSKRQRVSGPKQEELLTRIADLEAELIKTRMELAKAEDRNKVRTGKKSAAALEE